MTASENSGFLNSSAGRAVSIGGVIIALLACGYVVWSSFAKDETTAYSSGPWFVCSETGKPFRHTLQAGEKFPIYSSYSGKNTGYPAELCFWTKDGQIKKEPTPVLVNAWLGKNEPTFCPDCGRLVVAHNPPPVEGHAPPTKEQYSKRGSNNFAAE